MLLTSTLKPLRVGLDGFWSQTRKSEQCRAGALDEKHSVPSLQTGVAQNIYLGQVLTEAEGEATYVALLNLVDALAVHVVMKRSQQ